MAVGERPDILSCPPVPGGDDGPAGVPATGMDELEGIHERYLSRRRAAARMNSSVASGPASRGPVVTGGNDLEYSPVAQLSLALRERRISAVELVARTIDRIERLDVRINSIPVRRFAQAMAEAEIADAALKRGDDRPLLGIPMTVKESFNLAGFPTTWGMPAFRSHVAGEDALAVSRVRDAGAVILGKTNVPFALADWQSFNDIHGSTANPWDLSRTAGGSSGGSAAALAAGFGAVSLGSDIGGSLRAPAHYCGVCAHKPSHGLVPPRGHVPPTARTTGFVPDLSVIGPMARNVADLRLLLDLISVPDPRGPGIGFTRSLPEARHTALRDYRVFHLPSHPLMPVENAIQAALGKLVDGLPSAVGGTSRHLPDLVASTRLYMRLLWSYLAASWPEKLHDRMMADAAALPARDRSLAAERLRGCVLSHRDWVKADAERAELKEGWHEFFRHFDVIVCPPMPTVAFPHDRIADSRQRRIVVDGVAHPYLDQLFWAGIATVAGLPSTVVPIGFSPGGLPMGVQIIGPYLEDATTLRFADLLETSFHRFSAPVL